MGTKVKIRLYGIDAPETEKSNKKTGHVSKPGQPYGEEAYQALKKKIDRQKVKFEVMDIDRYKRAVSILRLDNRNINSEMVREGFAWAYRQYLDRTLASDTYRQKNRPRRSTVAYGSRITRNHHGSSENS
ncbi:putative endonuclease LCL3 [Geobacter sp. OR-1]|uniref:thermonuclease family protein n=1 Tax=Geobacter sp. OR-1 TaxID=1266765 RepID=UPI00054358FE|nr:thermonuclease family protein [Geobacter sp. OR-1]GAM08262.1 putative endonuclease LCL3 [Geobacter sp. OR-1]